MKYNIGVAGSHRVGKSTLCRKFSELSGVPFLQTNAATTFKRLGMSPSAGYDFATRLLIQAEILADLEVIYKNGPAIFLTDRTPLDVAAYTLSEYNRSTLKEVSDVEVMAHLDRCVDLSARYIGSYMIIQPGIPIVESETSAPSLAGYMEHVSAIVIGLAMSNFVAHAEIALMPRSMVRMTDRIESLNNIAIDMTKQMHRESPVKQVRPC